MKAPAMTFAKVDVPEPLPPTIASRSTGSILRLMPRSENESPQL